MECCGGVSGQEEGREGGECEGGGGLGVWGKLIVGIGNGTGDVELELEVFFFFFVDDYLGVCG